MFSRTAFRSRLVSLSLCLWLLLALCPSVAALTNTNFLTYSYTPRIVRHLDPNAVNEGVAFNHEAPVFQDCSYVRPSGFAPTKGTITYGFQAAPGEIIRNIIASQTGTIATVGGITGEYSTDNGATFVSFFQTDSFPNPDVETNIVTGTRANLRSVNASTVLIRYTLTLTHDDNFQVQFCRDCDDQPFSLRFDFDVPVSFIDLPRHLFVTAENGGAAFVNPGKAQFAKGETVVLTANPAPGYLFRGWVGDEVTYENPLPVHMDQSKTIVATFELATNLDHCLSPPAGLAHWWPGDGTALDLVTGKTAVQSVSQTFTAGQVDPAFNFDGLQDYFIVPGPSLPAPWTFAVWVNRLDSLRNGAALLSTDAGAIKIEQINSTRKIGLTRYGTADWSFTYSVPQNRWTHLAFVATAGSTRLYVNGQLEDILPNTIVLPLARVGIGKDSGSDLFRGAMDELLVFNRALTTEEINTIFNAGKSGLCKPPKLLGAYSESDGTAAFRIFGSIGQRVLFVRSTDLIVWHPYSTNVNTTGIYDLLVNARRSSAFFRVGPAD